MEKKYGLCPDVLRRIQKTGIHDEIMVQDELKIFSLL